MHALTEIRPDRRRRVEPEHTARGQPGRFERWTMASIAVDGAANWPDRVALRDGAVSLTYRELFLAARELAVRLLEAGVRAGDRVAIVGDRDPDTVVAIFGTCMAGASYVPLDVTSDEERLRDRLLGAEVSLLLGPEALRGALPSGIEWFSASSGLAQRRYRVSWRRPALPSIERESIAYLMYGRGDASAKAVRMEHRNVRALFDGHNERARIGPDDRCLNLSPFHGDGSLLDTFLPLYAGATVVFPGKVVSPTQMLRLIERHRLTYLGGVATELDFLTGDGRQLDRHDLRSLRLLHSGGEPGNVRTPNEWLRRLPKLAFLHSYGVRELGGACISYLKPHPGEIREPRCPIGRPHRQTRARLVANDGTPITRPGEPGELIVAGAQLMPGYFRASAESSRAFVWHGGERFLRTGDLAYVDQAGDYHFVSRMDETLEVAGDALSLADVARALQADAVVEAAFPGLIARESRSELAVSVVTTRPLDPGDARKLAERVESHLPPELRPRRWAFLLSVPRAASGKADRHDLLDRLESAVREHDARFYSQSAGALRPLIDN